MASVSLSGNGDDRNHRQISCNCSASSMEKLRMDDASTSSDHRRSMSENTSWETEEDGSLSRLNVGQLVIVIVVKFRGKIVFCQFRNKRTMNVNQGLRQGIRSGLALLGLWLVLLANP